MTPEFHDQVATRLRARDQRYTRGRRDLIEVLSVAEAPLTIPQVLDRSPGLAQSSAYRNLAVLEDAEAVHRLVTADEHARYELAEDLTGHHHHLICSNCGDVRDIEVPAALERQLDRTLGEAAQANRFSLDHHRLDLIGTCADCG